jgi:hypothetical protein
MCMVRSNMPFLHKMSTLAEALDVEVERFGRLPVFHYEFNRPKRKPCTNHSG